MSRQRTRVLVIATSMLLAWLGVERACVAEILATPTNDDAIGDDAPIVADEPTYPIGFSEIESSYAGNDLASASPHTIPLPPAVWTGLMGLVTAGAAIAFRRRL